jgi:uncharacterized protein YbjT (DUF2867 family)
MSRLVLIAGATGYVGSRLLRRFEEGGTPVRCMVRNPTAMSARRETTQVVYGDCLDAASLAPSFAQVDTAYYLVHSMTAGSDFAELDRRAARNFARVAAESGVRRIVYLGGLVDDTASASAHLHSRAETGAILRESGVPVIELRASIIIGANGLSFEMIRMLVERLPLMVCPRWVSTATQPIAIDDVIAYLDAARDVPLDGSTVIEIGGPEVVSYGGIMRAYARLRGLRRFLIPVPVLTPRLSGLWLALVTPSQAQVGRSLVEGLRNPTVVRSNTAREVFGIKPMPLDEALRRAIDDPSAGSWKVDSRTVDVDASPARAFAPIQRIGGRTGWYYGNSLWAIRGWLDSLVGGVGMGRGRHDPERCGPGDVIDGWTVEVLEPNRRLRLSADMRLPGRAWLEFEVTPLDNGRGSRIRQTAIFDPRGLLGRAYWYAVLPVHNVMFQGMLRSIAARS